jgi:hypothetical protein
LPSFNRILSLIFLGDQTMVITLYYIMEQSTVFSQTFYTDVPPPDFRCVFLKSWLIMVKTHANWRILHNNDKKNHRILEWGKIIHGIEFSIIWNILEHNFNGRILNSNCMWLHGFLLTFYWIFNQCVVLILTWVCKMTCVSRLNTKLVFCSW